MNLLLRNKKVMIGLLLAIIFIPIIIQINNASNNAKIERAACPTLTTENICQENSKCQWSSSNNYCCGKDEYASPNAFGVLICCKSGTICN